MKTIKGPAIFSRSSPATRRRSTRSTPSAGWAAGLGYKGVQIPTWDARLFDLRQGGREQDLLRRGQGHAGRATASRSPSSRRTCRASWSPCIRPTTPLRRLRAAEVRGNPAARQAWAVRAGASACAGLGESRPHGARDLLGRAGLALSLSLAAAPAGLIENAFDELARALDADPRRLRRGRRRSSATRSIPARTCTTA